MRSSERPSLFSRWHQTAASAVAMLLCMGVAWAQSTTANTADTAVASGLRWHWATSAGLNS